MGEEALKHPDVKKAPDLEGFGRAWRIDPLKPRHVDQTATVAGWLVHAPHGNPFWPWYIVSAVHLRDIEGQSKPAVKKFAEASHEFLICAINPETYPQADPENWGAVGYLEPIDLAHQLGGLTDTQAGRIVEEMVKAVTFNGASPDQDFRRMWQTWLEHEGQSAREEA